MMTMSSPLRRLSSRRDSTSSDEGSKKPLEPPVLVYHESARSIVFRDHLRRAANRKEKGIEATDISEADDSHRHSSDNFISIADEVSHVFGNEETVAPTQAGIPSTQIAGFQPRIQALPSLSLGPNDEFEDLLKSPSGDLAGPAPVWTPAEAEVVELLRTQRCCVKTIKNTEWTQFLQRFQTSVSHRGPAAHNDIPSDAEHHFNSFVTSTSLLPPSGEKMRCYGSTSQYTIGVVFALPTSFGDETEDEAQERTETWSWPAGYSAKTEFNIDSRSGKLINGRQEVLRSLSTLREYNRDYLTKDEYMISTRRVSGLSQIPYNEVFLRVGGFGRIVNGRDVATGFECVDGVNGRSFDRGVGIPVALFVRSATFGHLVSLLRARSRVMHVLGERHIKGIPLILICPNIGVRVVTEKMQRDLWKIASSKLNPFQSPTYSHRTSIDKTDMESFQQKVDELLDLDESIREILTPEELAHLAGGFGATDESVASVLKQVMIQDRRINKEREVTSSGTEESHRLQDVVNEGLEYAVRSGDYNTARQLLILYSLVAAKAEELDDTDDDSDTSDIWVESPKQTKRISSLGDTDRILHNAELARRETESAMSSHIPAPPPPPPLDTDRLRSATNSDGLLAVLGAAQVLKAMQDGSAKKRSEEVVSSLKEWITHGEQSVAFRISSWYDQRAAQGDLKIATENNSNFMAFVSNKAIANRKNFADQLGQAVASTDFTDRRFLFAINEILMKMHSPCLRLELLQYVLGLDNRYSVAHVKRSVELAATCLNISAGGR